LPTSFAKTTAAKAGAAAVAAAAETTVPIAQQRTLDANRNSYPLVDDTCKAQFEKHALRVQVYKFKKLKCEG
jgi:hypothetical protein